jgi:hypothetical protein
MDEMRYARLGSLVHCLVWGKKGAVRGLTQEPTCRTGMWGTRVGMAEGSEQGLL